MKKLIYIPLISFLLNACITPFENKELIIKEPKHTASSFGSKDLSLLPSLSVKVVDPNESLSPASKEIEFEALDGTALLNKVFKENWKESSFLVFKCLDGYQPILPTKDFLNRGFYFAFKRKNSSFFYHTKNYLLMLILMTE